VGFASAVHYVHPDKPAPELWINEVGVASSQLRRGIARAILQRLLEHARDLGCTEAWVLTDRANQAAMALYQSAGGTASAAAEVMFSFPLEARA
jgi:GNAT superfamily N-acetyltransferase